MQIDVQDGAVACLPFAQANNDLITIRSLIPIGKGVSFAMQPTSNKMGMSASSDALKASIATFSVAKDDNAASPPSPLLNNKKWQKSICLHLEGTPLCIPIAFDKSQWTISMTD